MSLSLRIPIFLIILSGILFFSLHLAIKSTLPISFSAERLAQREDISKFSLDDLEVFLKEMLEKVRSGKSISFENEKTLRKIKAILAINSGVNQILVERLIAMIDNILEINSELIHSEDGNHQTDGD